MRKLTKALSLVTAVSMLGLLAGCSSKTPDASGSFTTAATNETAADFETNLTIEYNGTTVTLGDNINDKLDALGDQSKPSESVVSCVSADSAVNYYYPGLIIETNADGVIYSMDLCDDGFTSDNPPVTVKGIGLGCSQSDFQEAYGETNLQTEDGVYDFYNIDNFSVQTNYTDGVSTDIWMYDADLTGAQ